MTRLLNANNCLLVSHAVMLMYTTQDEWSGEQKLRYSDVMDNIEPESIRPMGNYAVAINWPDGFSQVYIMPLVLTTMKAAYS